MAGNNVLKSRQTSKEEISWIEHLQEEIRSTPERLEDAAKFIATMIGISLTIFLAIAKTGDAFVATLSIKIALFSWLFSLLLAFAVIFPFRYRCVSSSVQSIKRMHKRIVRLKWWLLIFCVLFFLVALAILIFKLL